MDEVKEFLAWLEDNDYVICKMVFDENPPDLSRWRATDLAYEGTDGNEVLREYKKTQPREEVGIDYGDMEARARPKTPTGVNWKAGPRPKTYAEIMDIRYDPDVEER